MSKKWRWTTGIRGATGEIDGNCGCDPEIGIVVRDSPRGPFRRATQDEEREIREMISPKQRSAGSDDYDCISTG